MADESMLLNPLVAFFLNHIPAAPYDCPSYSAAVLQVFIGRVDDGVHFINGDVALYDLQGLACFKSSLNQNGIHRFILPR